MALYVQVDLNFFEHRKITKGAKLAKMSPLYFGAHMIALWRWAMINCRDGVLYECSESELEAAAKWSARAQRMLPIALACGLIDLNPTTGVYELHDWAKYSGKVLTNREASAERVAKHRAKQKQDVTEACNSYVTPPCNADVTPPCNADVTPHINIIELNELNKININKETALHAGSPGGEPIMHLEPEALKKSKGKKRKEKPEVIFPLNLPFTIDRAMQIWNENKSAEQPGAEEINQLRVDLIAKKMKTFKTEEQWIAAVKNIASSEWHNGKGSNKWKAKFEWFLSDKGTTFFEGYTQSEGFDPKRQSKNLCQTNSHVDYSTMGITL